MGTKTYNAATDMITFSRASGGTALRRVGYGTELADPSATYSLPAQYNGISSAPAIGQTYRISITRTTSGGGFTLSLGGSSSGWITFTGTRIFYLTTTNTNTLTIRGDGNTSGNAINVSVKQIIFDVATDPLVLFNHADNIPRIEYDAAGAVKGLLIEEQRVNLFTYSNDFTASSWQKVVTVTPNDAVSPDGTSNASRFPFGSSGYFQASLSRTVGQTYTVSAWVKSYDGTDEAFQLYGENGGFSQNFVATSEWQRFSFTYTATSSAGGYGDGIGRPTTNIPADLHVYGMQLEAGGFPTSYIPTSGATATRAADVATIPTSAFGYNSGAGTVVVEASTNNVQSSLPHVWQLDAGSNSTRIVSTFRETSGSVRMFIQNSGSTDASLYRGSPLTSTTLVTSAGAWVTNNVAFSADGSAPIADTNGCSIPNANTLRIGGVVSAGTTSLNGHIKSIQYYPRRLSNAQLQELTT